MPRVAVIGAGAAGTIAAIFAAAGGADTLLLERTPDGGRKILISGGGRCNILPSRVAESRFVTDSSPHSLRNILRSWPLAEQIAFFERELGIPLVEETESSKLFPASNHARDVRDRLLTFARECGVQLQMGVRVTGLEATSDGWLMARESGDSFRADAVIVATGGLSVPKTGSDGDGLRFARQLGHTVHETYPALTPLTASPNPFAALAGVSLPVTITARADKGSREATARGGFLFTHAGFSGPSVLDVSHVAVRSRGEDRPARIHVSWSIRTAAEWAAALQAQSPRTVLGVVRTEVPNRLAEVLLGMAGIDPARTLSHITRDERQRLVELLVRSPLPCTGDEGYKKAEVTGGGVSLAEIDPRTMESRRHKRLFLCGEMLDAFGPIGGYNFLWSWATGRAAGIAAALV
jgi:predicted Rossmann fold flavoprotein